MRIAIVTGGTKGIGFAITKMLLQKGCHVIATYAYDIISAKSAMIEFKKISKNIDIVQCDQAKSEEVNYFTSFIKQKYNHVDYLVCNAGTTLRKCFEEYTNEEWENVMQVNVNSNVYLIRDLYSLLPPIANDNIHSAIILIGSMMGVYPHGTSLAYGVTKSAVHALATNLVKYFDGKNVTVNAIAPGFVETEWQKEKPQEIRNNICNKTALRRFATVEEIADAVKFCINNPYVNGSVIEISGGYSYK